MSASDFNDEWERLAIPLSGRLSGKSAPGWDSEAAVIIAIDSNHHRHLLIQAAEDSGPLTQPDTRGLEVVLDNLRVGDDEPRFFYDVVCRAAGADANFTAFASELVEALHPDLSNTKVSIEQVLARWRWFWGAPNERLSEERAIGLFGELWFLEYWLAPLGPATIEAWTGPTMDRHDFKWESASVEVKATRSRTDGSANHKITSLDQLEDPETGDLYLFSLQATPDPIGHHSLNASVDRIKSALEGNPGVLHAFEQKLGACGYHAAHRDSYGTQYRVAAEELYRVEGTFPRLTRTSFSEGVPDGVYGISYSVDLSACAQWRLETSPGVNAESLRASLGD